MKASIIFASVFAAASVASPIGWFNSGRSASVFPSVFSAGQPTGLPSGFPTVLGDLDHLQFSSSENDEHYPYSGNGKRRGSHHGHHSPHGCHSHNHSDSEESSEDGEHHSRVSASQLHQGGKYGFDVHAGPTGSHGKGGKHHTRLSKSGEESNLEDDEEFSGSEHCSSPRGHYGHHGRHSKSGEESGGEEHSRPVRSKSGRPSHSRTHSRPTADASDAAPSPVPTSA
ncbi:hypothetical protein DL89DRAFT_293525 [Linderina pennispora]|uniref:Uncharacterized protein n=1 Tax=Linderina pennispora TaxID=61395 RepID=A0A1Y1W698_9FUNG|nr:uncharacterized protein DL89DRAFT_293525 [Linderina pennispora]ORX69059.1 hypothetical protein DL89DRAFT_293525 [Linderina pennispora]